MDDDRRAAERAEDAALVARARGDDPDAFGRLYDRWFDRVHDLAFRIVHDDAAAADVAQDAFVAAWRNLEKLEKPEAFGGWLLRIARNGALDRKRKDARATPVDDEGIAMIEATGPSPASAPAGFRVEDRTRESDDPARAAEDNELASLVWESAAALGERDAEILDLGLRHGLTPAEVGEVIGMNRNAANQAVHRVRSRLKAAVEARVLWRSGEPVCAGLAGALEAADVHRFGAEAVKVATKHAEKCAACQERRQLRLEPSKMFAALPILSVPYLKQKIAHALDATDVPMGESQTLAEAPVDTVGGRAHPRVRRLVGAGVGIIVVVLAVGVLADDVDAPTTENALSTRATATTKADGATTTTAVVAAPTADPEAVTSTTRGAPAGLPGVEDPGAPGPQLAPPTAAPVTQPPEVGTATIRVAHMGRGLVAVTWLSSGGTSASVSGPGFSGSGLSGSSGAFCPVSDPRTGCATGLTHTYTMTLYGSSGQVLDQKSASVTV